MCFQVGILASERDVIIRSEDNKNNYNNNTTKKKKKEKKRQTDYFFFNRVFMVLACFKYDDHLSQ